MDVLFAVLPFADVNRPVIGVSLLQAAARANNIDSRIEYFNLDLAERIGLGVYETIASSLVSNTLVGEWFFADLVFGDSLSAESTYLSTVLWGCVRDPALRSEILEARRHRAQFIEECVRRIRLNRPRLVGFTTTFQQTCACLAVARRLKEFAVPPLILFGGANCEGEMGLQMIRSFPWIDFVSTGEADLTFHPFVKHFLETGRFSSIPGILKRDDDLSFPPRVQNMDELPIPDYADYFERVERSPSKSQLNPVGMVETSRGCWWGAKNHCTFCGLNGETMAFRSKSPNRAFQEFVAISETYGVNRLECVDNILDVRYIKTLFPRLAESGTKLDLFYEVKSNLRYDQLAMMRAGGVRMIQPGIESLSNQVLRLMKKGCTALHNIQLLRWCAELGIEVFWNLLAGFPGEFAGEYERQAELIPLLTHLPPPISCAPVRLDRFSPFYLRADEFGMRRIRPSSAYYHVFPLGRKELLKLAYFFDFDYDDGRNPAEYLAPLHAEVARWWAIRQSSKTSQVRLDAFYYQAGFTIEDTRPVAQVGQHQLTGLTAQIYSRCDSMQSLASLKRSLCSTADEAELRQVLSELVAARLMIEMDEQYLSLAVTRNRPPQENSRSTNAYQRIREAKAA
jgi:ribosomal peptide maturation radical SAM protein 1